MLWLYLHFPQLQLDHYRAASPEARPMALSAGHPPVIVQPCPLAAGRGIQPGQALATAQALCPSLIIKNQDEHLQQRQLLQLAQLIDQHAPLSLHPPDGLLIQATPLLKLYGSLSSLRQKLLQQTTRLNLQCQLGTGTTPRMAQLLARHIPQARQSTPAHMRAALAELPVSAAQWPSKTLQRLMRMGLRTLGAVMAQDYGELARRFDQSLVADLQRMTGERPDPQAPYQPPSLFDQRLEFMQEVHQTEALLFPLQRLVQALTDFLRLRQYITDTLVLVLYHPAQRATQLGLKTAQARNSTHAFMELIQLRLERLTLTDAVIALRLRTSRLLPQEECTSDLFETTASLSQPSRHQTPLLARLRTRLGERRVRHLATRDDHRPEQAWQWQPAPPRPLSFPLTQSLRPLWLLPQPVPLPHPPVDWLAGPERIQTGWWDQKPIQRDYYIARFADGATGWLFRAQGGRWFIHGWFG